MQLTEVDIFSFNLNLYAHRRGLLSAVCEAGSSWFEQNGKFGLDVSTC